MRLEPLDHASMLRILLEAGNNVLAKRKEFFALHSVKLQFSDAAIDELITRALSHGTGARALRHEVDQVLRQVEHRLPDMVYSGIDALLVERDTVSDGIPVREHKGGKKDLSTLLAIRRRSVGGKTDDVRTGDPDDYLCFF